VVRNAALEDVFVMKLIANRPGDAMDCAALFSAVLDLDAVFQEIYMQYRKPGPMEQEFGSQHPITKKLSSIHADAQALLQESAESQSRQ